MQFVNMQFLWCYVLIVIRALRFFVLNSFPALWTVFESYFRTFHWLITPLLLFFKGSNKMWSPVNLHLGWNQGWEFKSALIVVMLCTLSLMMGFFFFSFSLLELNISFLEFFSVSRTLLELSTPTLFPHVYMACEAL